MRKIRQPPLKFHYMHFGEKHMHFSILQHALLHPARDKIGIALEVGTPEVSTGRRHDTARGRSCSNATEPEAVPVETAAETPAEGTG